MPYFVFLSYYHSLLVLLFYCVFVSGLIQYFVICSHIGWDSGVAEACFNIISLDLNVWGTLEYKFHWHPIRNKSICTLSWSRSFVLTLVEQLDSHQSQSPLPYIHQYWFVIRFHGCLRGGETLVSCCCFFVLNVSCFMGLHYSRSGSSILIICPVNTENDFIKIVTKSLSPIPFFKVSLSSFLRCKLIYVHCLIGDWKRTKSIIYPFSFSRPQTETAAWVKIIAHSCHSLLPSPLLPSPLLHLPLLFHCL